MRITGVIQAGGRSTRMGGAPKALMELGGRRIVERVVAAIAPVVDDLLVVTANQVIAQIVGAFPSVHLVDVYGAFAGRHGLLLSERPHADRFEVHPSNAGYRVIAKAFAAAMGR